MSGKFSRSWELVKASASVLRADKELLVLPLLSSIAALLVAATFLVPLFATGTWAELRNAGGPRGVSPLFWVGMFAFYVVQYTVIFFFSTALVGAAAMRLDGRDPTVADGLRIASSRLGRIIGYALIAATVGMLLRALQERVGWLGRWVVGLLGVAWTAASFLVVPVLVHEDIGPVDAVKRSAELLKRSWGENLIGNVGLGLVFGLAISFVVFAGIGLTILAATQGAGWWTTLPVVATIVSVTLLALVQAALQGVYAAALYRYATTGDAGPGFDKALIADAFTVKA